MTYTLHMSFNFDKLGVFNNYKMKYLIVLGVISIISFVEIMTAMGTHTFKGYLIAMVLWGWFIWWVLRDTHRSRSRW